MGVVLGFGIGGFNLGAEFPEEADEFARNGYFDLVVMKLALLEHVESVAEPHLGGPGEGFDPGILSDLSLGELGADFGRDAVVGGLFDEDPAGVGISTFADASTACLGAA